MPRLLLALLLATNALAAGRELGPRPLGPSAYAQQTPLVAYAGGKYLAVWLESLNPDDGRYVGAFVDASGKRISRPAFLVSEGVGGAAQLVAAGDSFVLFFPRDPFCPQMVIVNLEGRVTARHLLPIEYVGLERPVAWNGTHFAFVDDRRVVFFDREGHVVRKVEILCSPVHNDIAAAGGDVVVASVCRGGILRTHVVTAEGTATTTMIDRWFPEKGVRIAAARAGNGTTLLVWGTDDSLHSAVLSPDGMSAPQQLADRAAVPLLLTKTPQGFLLAFTIDGRLNMVTLDDDGSLRVVHHTPANTIGRVNSAATDGRNVLVAGASHHARAWLLTPDAQLAASDILSVMPARQLAPAIGAGTESLVAVWTELQGTPATMVRAARLAPDGKILGTATIDRNAALASDDLAWNGASYLTVILVNGQLRTQRITAFGERIGDSQPLYDLPANVRPHVAVVWAGDRWVVVGTDGTLAFYSEVAAGGDRMSWSHLPLEGPLSENDAFRDGLSDVALAYDGERVHVAWLELHVPCTQECIGSLVAFVATIDDHGTTIGRPRLVSDPVGYWQTVSLAANAGEVVTIANSYQDTALVTTSAGASRAFDGAGDVTWDGSTFVVALRARGRLTVRRLDGQLRDAGHPRITSIAPSDTRPTRPAIATVIPGNAIIGIQEIDVHSGARAVAYVEQELEYEYEPVRR